MADESRERVEETPKVKREDYKESVAADAAESVTPEPPEGAGDTPDAAEAEDVSVKLNSEVVTDAPASVTVAGYEDVKLYEGKATKVSAAHADALVNSGLAVRAD